MSLLTKSLKEQLKNAFDQLQVGQTFTFIRTLTDNDVSAFCGITGKYNPYRIDEQFAHENSYGNRIIPGLLIANMVTHIGGMLGFLATKMQFNYIAPTFVGDTLTCVVAIEEKDETTKQVQASAKLVNQEGKEVLIAKFTSSFLKNKN